MESHVKKTIKKKTKETIKVEKKHPGKGSSGGSQSKTKGVRLVRYLGL
jgi:hypothetical protein